MSPLFWIGARAEQSPRPGARCYAIDSEPSTRVEAQAWCDAILDVVRPAAETACIDAYSDFSREYTDEARAAERDLFARGRLRSGGFRWFGRGDPGMAIDLDLTSADDWSLLRSYGPWSINADVLAADAQWLATFHDCAVSISFALTTTELAALHARLPDVGITPLRTR